MVEQLPLTQIDMDASRERAADDSSNTPLTTESYAHAVENRALLNNDTGDRERTKGGATVFQTSLNMAKMCMGTGTLALPFAAEKGGLLFNIIGLLIIGLWNYYSANCLLRCLQYLPPDLDNNTTNTAGTAGTAELEHQQKYGAILPDTTTHKYKRTIDMMPPPPGTTTYGKVAWYAAGPKGLMVLDLLMLSLFLGLLIAYEVAMMSFIDATPLTTGSRKLDLLMPNTIVIIFSCVPDYSLLTKCSGIGLVAVALSFIVISFQGFVENGWSGFQGTSHLNYWPESVSAASSWFGVVVFGFGVVPFVFNFRESMASPQNVFLSMQLGLLMVYVGYIMISTGILILFSPSYTFEGDVLQAMPSTWISLIVRLLMILVLVTTSPLLVVPCGELIEGKLGIEDTQHASMHKRIMVRVLFCIFCMGVSLELPAGFVHVVSFIGCFCVAMTSFVMPPLFCIQLSTWRTSGMDFELLFDVGVLLLGIIATSITSTITFDNLLVKSG